MEPNIWTYAQHKFDLMPASATATSSVDPSARSSEPLLPLKASTSQAARKSRSSGNSAAETAKTEPQRAPYTS
eukprot:11180761-Lingulodinium_polyedra.AAC.1